MIRWVMRLTACALVVFVALLATVQVAAREDSFPLGTERSVSLDFSKSQLPKDEVVRELNALADRYDLTLIKPVPQPDEFNQGRDVLWFGTQPPAQPGPLHWFQPGQRGDLRPAADIGDATLNGSFMLAGPPAGDAALQEWADDAGVRVESRATYSALGTTARILAGTFGLVALASLLLLAASALVAWMGSLAKARNLRLLAGVTPQRIHVEDVGSMVRMVVVWCAAATGLVAAAAAVIYGPAQLGALASPYISTLLVCVAIIAVLAWLASVITRPKVGLVAQRRPPVAQFNGAMRSLKVLSLLVALVSLPAAIAQVERAQESASSAGRWEAMSDVVAVRCGGSADEEQLATYYPDLTAFLTDAHASGLIEMAYDVTAYTIADTTPGGFDAVVVTNPAYLQRWGASAPSGPTPSGVPAAAGGQGGATVQLMELAPGQLPAAVRDDVEANLQLWTRAKAATWNGLQLFTAPAGSIPVPVAGEDGMLAYPHHPLLIVAADPVATLDTSAFLFPAITTGQLMFAHGGQVADLVDSHRLRDLVISIDRVADTALAWAQTWATEARARVLAVALIALALVLTVAFGARTWAGTRVKQIFALRTAGAHYALIAGRRVAGELVVLVGATALACAIAAVGPQPDPARTALLAAIVAVPYALGTVWAYRQACACAFSKAAHRES